LQPQDLADIIAYVGNRSRRGNFPANKPAVVNADSDGTLRLAAAQARIYGSRLIFEIKHQTSAGGCARRPRRVDV